VCPRGGAFDRFVPGFGEAATAAEPSKGSFNNPSARQHDKAFGDIGAFDDFDGPFAMADECLRQFGPGIAAVGEDVTQPGKAETKGLYDLGSAVPILDIGGMDQHEEQETQRIGNDVTLEALDLPSF